MNVAKHSGAENVALSLVHEEGTLRLPIKDDGRGLDMEKTLRFKKAKGSIGLASMRERSELSGGLFSIDFQENEGTVVCASWGVSGRIKKPTIRK
jgi:signal transduction histidine kinase